MCCGAIVHSRIRRLVFGAREPKAGAVLSQNRLLEHAAMNTRVEVTSDVLAESCSGLISSFFDLRRKKKKALKLNSKTP
ncbi:hypothetical protein A3765_27280 [Oleiphilus sp. HI0130]|nr:hypothetical protein A3765_27280 [Oleiphilus sp. HI0130]